VRQMRHEWHIRLAYKMVDTCAAEFDAATPYFYSTYEQENEAVPENVSKAVVIGSGPIRIGQGIEFDYCSVHSAWALQESGYKSIMINSNPETVSTDFDTSSRLYFEALDEESVRDILENENDSNSAPPSIVQFGGQTAINLSQPLSRLGMPLLGSSAEAIDLASDRRRFEKFLEELGVPQPPGAGVTSLDEGLNVAKLIGYPVLVRPSYVLGGRAMEIVYNATELVRYMSLALELDTGHPILIDKYLQGKEVEVDAIADGETVLIPGIMEHIERAGVHSGDSMAVYPGVNLTQDEVTTLVDYSTRIGLALKIKGLMNIQFVIMRGDGRPSSVYVIEVNPRASRTVPFISKVTGVPMVNVATKVMLGKNLREQGYSGGLWPVSKLVAIKAPVFSMSKLAGVDTYLGPEMKSTGEVMGIDYNFIAALAKTLVAAGLALPPQGGILFSLADRDKPEALPIIRKLAATGSKLYATEGTAAMIEAAGLPVKMTSKKLNEGHPNIIDLINDGTISGVVNTITGGHVPLRDGFHIRRAATEKRIPCFTSLDTLRAAAEALASGSQFYTVQPLPDYRTRGPA
jgi:carbamoyl-phosphate synthase large subunit